MQSRNVFSAFTARHNRRQFLTRSSLFTATAALAFPAVLSGKENDLAIKIGLIGCGGRGTGAIGNALQGAPNVSVVALGDLFPDQVERCRQELQKLGVEVKNNRCFAGFDAYQKVCDVDDVNYVILATPPHFRPLHLRYAVEHGKHSFIEKPVAVDAPGVRSIIESGELAKKKSLAVGAGTQRRHQKDFQEIVRRLHDGAIGDLLVGRVYYNTGTLWHRGQKPDWSAMESQCRNWYYYTWLSGDHIVEQHIHNLDLMNWLFQAHPARASGSGGRQARTDAKFGNIYDHFAVEFEYPKDVRLFSYCRQNDGCEGNVSDLVIGSRGTSNCRNLITVKGEKPWRFTETVVPGHQQEHTDLIASIRAEKPLNEARAVAESTLMAIMGREAAYSGLVIEWDAALNSSQKLGPEKYAFDAQPPPAIVAIPGKHKFG
jgi:predicted dehydrogenase